MVTSFFLRPSAPAKRACELVGIGDVGCGPPRVCVVRGRPVGQAEPLNPCARLLLLRHFWPASSKNTFRGGRARLGGTAARRGCRADRDSDGVFR